MRLAVLAMHSDGYGLQRFDVDDDAGINLAGVLIHVLKVGAPAGTMRAQLLAADGSTVLTYADVALSTITDTYWHGMVYFNITHPLAAGTTYHLNMNSTSYSYASNAYFGLVLADGLAFKGNGGLDFRLLSYRNVNRGRS
jgi:hypothetical protein